VADIFVSYTSKDRDWAFWIGHELIDLGHKPHIYVWEIQPGEDIFKWMERWLTAADHCLCVISKAYLQAQYASWERRSAEWAAETDRPNFVFPIFIEECPPPIFLATKIRCDLHGLNEDEARTRLVDYLKPKAPSPRGGFPGLAKAGPGGTLVAPQRGAFPGRSPIFNIPIEVPRHFLGREEALDAIAASLKSGDGRVAITALHGLRGVGKTTLAAAYANRHRRDYRATWWIGAQSEPTLRADLVGLGVRLGWVAADEKEEPAFAAVMEKLRDEGEGILLIYDNAIDANSIKPFLPRGGGAQILVTSNFHAWRGIAAPVEIEVWPKEIGADFLIAHTGRADERGAAEVLSETLGGLPLAHEQAGAYCERLGVSFMEYAKRFEAAPAKFLDDQRHAPAEYHDRLTVAKTFALAIDEAAKLHPAAERLIVHAALLAPEPIPLYLFSEAREEFGEPLAAALADDGLDEAVAALRTFALVDREPIRDERDLSITTDCIRLHRLVREVAAARRTGEAQEAARGTLIAAMAALYPRDVYDDPASWPRARRLDALALGLVGNNTRLPTGTEQNISYLLNKRNCPGWATAGFGEKIHWTREAGSDSSIG
jgi:hypothetical protein